MQASSSNPGVWSVLGRSASSASAGRLLAVPALCLSSLCLAACGADLEGVEAPEGLDEDVFLADDAADGEDGAGATEALPAGSEGSELGSVSQALASGCTLLRPLGWSGRGVYCVEKPNTPLQMAHGQVYYAYSGVSGPLFGFGEARVRCNDGRISVEYSVCFPGGGERP